MQEYGAIAFLCPGLGLDLDLVAVGFLVLGFAVLSAF
jgi:hypothetical protein